MVSLRIWNCTYIYTYSLRIGFCAYEVRTDSGLLSVRFSGTKKAPVRVLVNKKTISNTHFSMGKFALQSQMCANYVTNYSLLLDGVEG